MKVHQLQMQAFGPFANVETVEFERLGAQSLFLIHGVTGAGKSAILDALCFALYGQTASKERDATQMRCHFSQDETLTKVVLIFSLADQKYKIERIPTQERQKTRGSGTTMQATRASLWQLGKIESKLEDTASEMAEHLLTQGALETTQKVESLTGLNVEQFRQIMVLPQGKFREFLMADSSQRELIFSRLFQTQIYSRIEEALKQQTKLIREEVEGLVHQISGLLQGVELEFFEALEPELERVNAQVEEQKKHCERAKENMQVALKKRDEALQLEALFEQSQAIEKKILELKAQEKNIEKMKQQLLFCQSAQKLAPLFEQVESLRIKVQEQKQVLQNQQRTCEFLEQQKEDAEKKLAEVETQNSQLPTRFANCARLESLIPKAEAYSSASKQNQELQLEKARLEKSLTEAIQSHAEHRQKQQKLQLNIAHNKNEVSKIVPLKLELQESHNRLRFVKEYEQVNQDFVNVKASISHLQEREASANEVFTKLQRKLQELELQWHIGQAARLAQQLENGVACPVCGSQEHPSPAQSSSAANSVSDADLSKAKEEVEAARQALSEIQRNVSGEQAKQDALTEKRKALAASLGGEQSESVKDVQERISRLEMQLQELRRCHETSLADEEKLKGIVAHAEQLQKNELSKRESLVQIQAQLSVSEMKLDELKLALLPEIQSPESYQALLNEEKDVIEKIKKAYLHAQQSTEIVKQKLSAARGLLEEYGKQSDKLLYEQDQLSSNWTLAIDESLFANQEAFIVALSEVGQSAELQQKIQQHADALLHANAQKEHVASQLSGRERKDISVLQSAVLESEKVYEQQEKLFNNARHRRDNLIHVKTKVGQMSKRKQEHEEKYALIGTLSQVASGQNSEKISLQRFVLSVLLDEVLSEASARLHQLSDGRYALVRCDQRSKGNRASGLDLEVDDAYTGVSRSVATLSGGESFIAALALALGLSDVVQAYAGGIRLDTLFVDEGFGSLDTESLDRAIQLLVDLQASGRTIGIISHVSELQEQIPLRIAVESTARGSHISM